MKRSIPENFSQRTFDFEALSAQPIEDLILHVNPILLQIEPSQEQQIRKDFYTYRLIRSDTGLPFYVGKGTKARIGAHEMNARNHKKDCNHRVCNTIRKLWREGHAVIREKIAEGITEKAAFTLEKLYISLGAIYGWNLCNNTNGGEGVSGYYPTDDVKMRRNEGVTRAWANPDLRAKKGNVSKKLWQDAEFRAKRKASLESPDVRKKMGDHFRGRANNAIAKTYPGFIAPDGSTIYTPVTNLAQFCRDHALERSNMRMVAQGKQYDHKGWTCYPPIEKPAKKYAPPKTPYTGFVAPDGQVHVVASSLANFCKEHDLKIGAMSRVNAGIARIHKGWTKYHP